MEPLNTLQNKLAQLGLSPYASTMPLGQKSDIQKFDYLKLREIQNI